MLAAMGRKNKSPDPPPPAPPPVSATGADMAQEEAAARKKAKRGYSFDNTILAGALATPPPGSRQTL